MSAWTCQEHGDKTDKDCLACEVVALDRENKTMKDVIEQQEQLINMQADYIISLVSRLEKEQLEREGE